MKNNNMTPAVSLCLDALRLSAALVVAMGHLTQPYFSTDWKNLIAQANDAVAVFFVLSGFVVRYTSVRHPDLADYVEARLCRLWSVVIPALAFTAIADTASFLIDPKFYQNWVRVPWLLPVIFPIDALFLNESYGIGAPPGSDTPIWSLGFEATYYLMFGLCFYLRGSTRVLAVIALLIVKGPNVLFLMPAWLLGVFLYDHLDRLRLSKATAAASLIAIPVAYFLHSSGRFDSMYETGHRILQPVRFLYSGRAENFMQYFTVAVLTSWLIVAISSLDSQIYALLRRAAGSIRFLSGATFSIYLFHFPCFVLIYSALNVDRSDPIQKITVYVATISFCMFVSLFTERRKDLWRPVVHKTVSIGGRLASSLFTRIAVGKVPLETEGSVRD